jgi:uncharacterized protein with HEPN domain
MQHDLPLLLDMAQAAHDILDFAQGMDFSALVADRKTRSALIHQFLVLGEAADAIARYVAGVDREAFLKIADPWDAKSTIGGFLRQSPQEERGPVTC